MLFEETVISNLTQFHSANRHNWTSAGKDPGDWTGWKSGGLVGWTLPADNMKAEDDSRLLEIATMLVRERHQVDLTVLLPFKTFIMSTSS
jgi:hypothetical protein